MKNLFLVCLLSMTFFTASASTAPYPEKPKAKKAYKAEPCTATITDRDYFYVYNCGGNNYETRLEASCTKTAPTCAEASQAAMNCANDALKTAAGNWKKQIRDNNCPETTIDWID